MQVNDKSESVLEMDIEHHDSMMILLMRENWYSQHIENVTEDISLFHHLNIYYMQVLC